MQPLEISQQISFSSEKHVTRLLHDSEKMRAVLFCLLPGQKVEPHTSTSEVFFYVIQGKGTFTLGQNKAELGPSGVAVSPPNEPHGFEANEKLVLLAVIAPRP